MHTGGSGAVQVGPATNDQLSSSDLLPGKDASIDLPPSLFDEITNRSVVGLFYALHVEPTLFPVGAVDKTVISPVLATTVGPNIKFENLQDNVTISLRTYYTTEQVLKVCTYVKL